MHDALSSEGVLVLDRADRLEAYRRLSLRPGAELTHASILKIGDSLDASTVIYGSYELTQPATAQSKGSLRIEARIIDLKHTHQGPTFSETGALEDLASLQAHLGWQALESLRPKNGAVRERVPGSAPAGAPRRRRKLRARTARHLRRTAPPLLHTIGAPRRALLAALLSTRQNLLGAEGVQDRRRLAPARHAQPTPHYLEAQFFLGLCRYYSGDFAGAEQAFQLVAAAVPLNEVFNNLGAAQDRQNKSADAVVQFPKSPRRR